MIELIRDIIKQRASQTRQDVQTIQNAVQSRLDQMDHQIENDARRLGPVLHSQFRQAEERLAVAHQAVIVNSRHQLGVATDRIATQRETVIRSVPKVLYDGTIAIDRSLQNIGERTTWQIQKMNSVINMIHSQSIRQIQSHCAVRSRELDNQYWLIGEHCRTHLKRAANEIIKAHALVLAQVKRWLHQAGDDAWRFHREIHNQGPEKTLKRGFALVRDTADHPVTSRVAASTQTKLILEFHDGRMTVKRDTDDE